MSQSTTKGTGRNVLSIDGCGFRGLTQLLVLKRLMKLHGETSQPPTAESLPCRVFDLICGTAAGGLIAVLLGRLGMTCDQAIDAYTHLESTFFDTSPRELAPVGSHTIPLAHDPRPVAADPPPPATPPRPTMQDVMLGSSFSTDHFRTALERIIENFAGASNAPMVPPSQSGTQRPSCRTVVTVVSTSTAADTDPDRIRSYPAPQRRNGPPGPGPAPPPGGWTIFHAAIGTASCPRLFDPLAPNQHGFMAANTSGFSNPSMIAYLEALDLFGENTPLTLISLGMGLRSFRQYRSLSEDGTDVMLDQLLLRPDGTQLHVDAQLRNRLSALIDHTQLAATSTEIKHSRLYDLIGRKSKHEYLRFDPDRGDNPFVFIDYVQIPWIQQLVHRFLNNQTESPRLDQAVEFTQGVASKWIQLPGYTCDSNSTVLPLPAIVDTMNPTQIMRECYRWESANADQYVRCFSISSGGLANSVTWFTGAVDPIPSDDPDGTLYVRVLVDDEWLFFQQHVAWEGNWDERIGNSDGSLRDPVDVVLDVRRHSTNTSPRITAFRSDGHYTTSTRATAERVRFYRFEFTHPYHGTWVRNDRR